MDDAKSRPGHNQNSDESDPDRGPAAGAYPFAEDRSRQRGDKERRRKCDGENLIKSEIFEGKKIQQGRAQQQGRPADLEDGPSGAQQSGAVQRIGNDQSEQERKGVARPYDLKHVDLAAEIFRGRIEECKRADRTAHERDADEAGAARSGCVSTCVATRWGSDILHRSLAIALSCQRRSTRYDRSDRARKIAIPAMDSRISAANIRGMFRR